MRQTLESVIVQAFLKNWITKTMKGKRDMLSGYKTYIVAGIGLLLACLHLAGIDVPGVSASAYDIGGAIAALLAVITGRVGARSDAAKAAFIASPTVTSVDAAKSAINATSSKD